MKKSFFILTIMVLATGALHAQDTISYLDTNYMYLPLNLDAEYYIYSTDYVPCSMGASYWYHYDSTGLHSYITQTSQFLYTPYPIDHPVTIHGIAVTDIRTPEEYHSDSDTLNYEMYVVLIAKEDSVYWRVDSIKWEPQRPSRYFAYPLLYSSGLCVSDTIVPSYEFYFEKPITLRDTFYVGMSIYPTGTNPWYTGGSVAPHVGEIATINTNGGRENHIILIEQSQYSDFDQTRNHFYCPSVSYGWGGFFPILTPRDSVLRCDPVWDLHMTDSTDTSVTLAWDGGNASQWEVEYAETTGTTAYSLVTNSPMATLTGLRPSTVYMAHVRAMCSWDSVYGDWTDFVEARTGAHQSDTTHDTIPDTLSISALSALTRLMPNPTSGLVTVTSTYRLVRLVVYDLQGHTLLEHSASSTSATLDVGSLPKGVYVVSVHTTAGIATKRLVVE